ncbi:cysteine-rich repeat secretory protein 38-like [Hibiscus syriacus]|uniref:Cysteine-rich repeat secretory protein 38-like n=1 Tax=Hibiscus syriacus TaxID=106335 RepID=A0A6A2YZP7_HIBSY|nr:cysteine-rich repeat secretory protein 38-like [Hibiscus syriacus]
MFGSPPAIAYCHSPHLRKPVSKPAGDDELGNGSEIKDTNPPLFTASIMPSPSLLWKFKVALFLIWGFICCKIGWGSVMRMSADLRDLFLYEAFLYYNPLLLVTMMVWLWGLCLWVFSQSTTINYAKIFELDQNHLTQREIWKCSIWMTVIVPTSTTAYLYLYSHGEVSLAAAQPPISFPDFFLADILTSMAKLKSTAHTYGNCFLDFSCILILPDLLKDLERSVCRMVHRQVATIAWLEADSVCGSHSAAIPLVLVIPYIWRLMQCLRQYMDTKEKTTLLNALKYHVLPDTWTSVYRRLWLFSSLVNSLYSFYWDVTHDWDLRSSASSDDRQSRRGRKVTQLKQSLCIVEHQSLGFKRNGKVYLLTDNEDVERFIAYISVSQDDVTLYVVEPRSSIVGRKEEEKVPEEKKMPREYNWNMPELLQLPEEELAKKAVDCYTKVIRVKKDDCFDTKEDLKIALGSPEASFAQLPAYCHNLKLKNPGSVTHIKTDRDGRFELLFIAIGATIRSFITCMRPVIIVDGAHLKGRYLGVNLLAVAMDANNGILPIAYGANSIDNAVRRCFPDAFHGLCGVHLYRNLKSRSAGIKKHKWTYWKAVKAYREVDFNKHINCLRRVLPQCAQTLEDVGFERWSRVHQLGARYGFMTSNSAESINALSRHSRKLPITMLMEFFEPLFNSGTLEHRVTPWTEKKITKRVVKSTSWRVEPFALHLNQDDSSAYAMDCYTTEVYRQTYAEIVYPIPHPSEWDIPDDLQTVLPPAMDRRLPGRPKSHDRIPSKGEEKKRSTCSRCKESGHTRLTCGSPVPSKSSFPLPNMDPHQNPKLIWCQAKGNHL